MRSWCYLGISALAAACSTEDPSTDGDVDATTPDIADDADEIDSHEPEADAPDSATDGSDGETGTPIMATPGLRCPLTERIGLVELEVIDEGQLYLSARLEDRPSPWFGPPELTSNDCAFHRFEPTICPPCDPAELCAIDGTCALAPRQHTDGRVVVTAGGASDVFAADPTTGDLWGTVTVTGPSYALDVSFADTRVTLAASEPPSALDDLDGDLAGGYEAPTRLDLRWTSHDSGTHVYTNIPINHHAAGPTFTECTVASAAGALSVGEAMLAPLAVITGLEFQGIAHVRFAAADTPVGCVELRLLRRHYVDL